MSGDVTYVFYAIDKPLSRAQRAEVQTLSRRVNPTGRRADFSYHVDGYDIPGGYEALMAKYYDVMVRQDYEQWTLGMAFPYQATLYRTLRTFQCDDGGGCGVQILKLDPKFQRYSRRQVTKPTRLLVEITAYLNYDLADKLTGLRDLPWERASETDDDEAEFGDESSDEAPYGWREGAFEEALALLANCLREDITQGDWRSLYLVWERLHDPEADPEDYADPEDAPGTPTKPRTRKKLPAYLKHFQAMLRSSSDR